MTAAWQEFSLSDIDSAFDYEFKFQDGHTEKWYGEEILDASESQGSVFIFNIVEMKKLSKPSADEIQKRIKESKDWDKAIKLAAKYTAERNREIMNKAGLDISELKNLSEDDIRNRFEKEKKKFPNYKIELDFLEALTIRDAKRL